MVHIGSWGLPDLGITEAIQSWINPKSAYSAEGGSNLFGSSNSNATSPTLTGEITGTGQGVGGAYPAATYTSITNPNSTNPAPTNQDNGVGESAEQRAINEYNDRMRGQIEGGYNDYFSQLDQMFSGLDTQANANLGIVNNSYNQSIADLQANKASSLGDLGLTEQKLQSNQIKNLRDIASNIQNQYMAGNVMLGARGAGDSSAANQYSYALNRVGSKARGDVMNQTAQSQQEIENQKAKLNNIVTQETSRLDTELGKVKLGISEWLAEQQNAVRGMIAEGKLNKGKDLAGLTQNLLNQALSAYQTKAQEISAKKSQLETWAMNNSANINQLKSNLQSIGQFTPNMPVAPTVNGSLSSDAQGNIRGIYGYGASKEEENRGY